MDREVYLLPIEKAFAIYETSPYGDMWRKMSYHELVGIAAYKARRASLPVLIFAMSQVVEITCILPCLYRPLFY